MCAWSSSPLLATKVSPAQQSTTLTLIERSCHLTANGRRNTAARTLIECAESWAERLWALGLAPGWFAWRMFSARWGGTTMTSRRALSKPPWRRACRSSTSTSRCLSVIAGHRDQFRALLDSIFCAGTCTLASPIPYDPAPGSVFLCL